MRTRSATLILAAIALGVTACQPTQPAALSEEDLQGIRDVTAQWQAAAVANDNAGLAALYTEEAVFMPPNQPAVEGRASIQTWIESFPAMTTAELVIDEIDGRGDLAFVRGHYDITMTGPDGALIPDRGKYLEIRRRQPDGAWLLAVDIFNSDLPQPE